MLRKLVSDAVRDQHAKLQQAAEKDTSTPPQLEPVPSASATTLSDKAIAIWLTDAPLKVPSWEGKCDALAVLRDELSIVQELAALQQQAVEHSGTWEPDSADAKRSEEELIADYFRELVEDS